MCPSGGCIVDPVFNKEEMLIADLNLDQVVKSRIDFDVAGHYSRPDILELIVYK